MGIIPDPAHGPDAAPEAVHAGQLDCGCGVPLRPYYLHEEAGPFNIVIVPLPPAVDPAEVYPGTQYEDVIWAESETDIRGLRDPRAAVRPAHDIRCRNGCCRHERGTCQDAAAQHEILGLPFLEEEVRDRGEVTEYHHRRLTWRPVAGPGGGIVADADDVWVTRLLTAPLETLADGETAPLAYGLPNVMLVVDDGAVYAVTDLGLRWRVR